MAIFANIIRALQQRQIPFLIIGGHAAVMLGHYRNTFDLDLLLPELQLTPAWQELEKLGYTKYFETDAFLQLKPPAGLLPLDLMIVDEETFSRILQFALEKEFDGEKVLIPDPLRFLALKLHATRSGSRRRETDWEDIVTVMRRSDLDIENSEIRQMLERYGGPKAEAEIRRRLEAE
jgi:hypothetical protein